MFVFQAKGLQKEIDGKTIFKNIDLSILQGKHFALIGKNGVSKTTLLECLFGIRKLDKEEIKRFVPANEWGFLRQNLNISSNPWC
ncbi:ATP-binding cassette domain-containing protein [Heyndrickxia coagulans]|uniref:ATP-binding cassette domain-containing protein n=1 Tax=Heyndrickxia coagulans TaxID=1398 RepID=UPI0003822626|nr:ATP-binding cassette domain-containing protein [Heyndrickxia coagulans]RGR83027.1 ATP-binding cassette domain-containing protein [Heyndrickxia coagulans]RGR98050.1 ATP-binding cassette domain-containing protein [Heyndrickxia coagulans]